MVRHRISNVKNKRGDCSVCGSDVKVHSDSGRWRCAHRKIKILEHSITNIQNLLGDCFVCGKGVKLIELNGKKRCSALARNDLKFTFHALTSIDVANRIADCSICGTRIAIHKNGNNSWRCAIASSKKNRRLAQAERIHKRHNLKDIDIKNKKALCSICGVVSLEKRKTSWGCAIRIGATRKSSSSHGLYPIQVDMIKNHITKCQNLQCQSEIELKIDHDHSSGNLRGVLCNACNLAEGILKSNAARMRGLADYIDNPPGIKPSLYYLEELS